MQKVNFVHVLRNICLKIIKIMSCVEGDRSGCQPEANSIARSQRAMMVVEVDSLMFHSQNGA